MKMYRYDETKYDEDDEDLFEMEELVSAQMLNAIIRENKKKILS